MIFALNPMAFPGESPQKSDGKSHELLGKSDFFRDFPAFQAQADGKDGVFSTWLGDPEK